MKSLAKIFAIVLVIGFSSTALADLQTKEQLVDQYLVVSNAQRVLDDTYILSLAKHLSDFFDTLNKKWTDSGKPSLPACHKTDALFNLVQSIANESLSKDRTATLKSAASKLSDDDLNALIKFYSSNQAANQEIIKCLEHPGSYTCDRSKIQPLTDFASTDLHKREASIIDASKNIYMPNAKPDAERAKNILINKFSSDDDKALAQQYYSQCKQYLNK